LARIIAIANQKGGVGKTTTVINLGASLAAAEKRVLLVDFDPQANCTSGLGLPRKGAHPTIYTVLTGRSSLEEAVVTLDLPYLSALPGSVDLAGAEVELVSIDKREYALKEALGSVGDRYDFILIDCPPSLGLLTVNALVAADEVLIPIQAEYFALEGVSELLGTLERIRGGLNEALEIRGVLLTMFDERTNLGRQVSQEIQSYFGNKVYANPIPRNIRLAEAPSFGKPVLLYDIASKGAQSYLQVAQEFLSHER